MKAGETVSVTNTAADAVRFNVYELSIAAVESAYNTLNEQTLSVDDFSDTHISGHIDVKEAGRLVLSIPSEKGWTMKVDGKDAEYEDFSVEDVTAADAQGYGCVIIDEAQFLTKAQVEMLVEMVDDYDVPVIAYGLRADFQNNFFEGSQWLMAWADTIEEIKTICWCGRKATCNARVVDGRVVQEGEQVVLGGNGQYVSLCRKHFRRGELGDFKDLHLGED